MRHFRNIYFVTISTGTWSCSFYAGYFFTTCHRDDPYTVSVDTKISSSCEVQC